MTKTAEIFKKNLKRLRKAKFAKQELFAPLVNLSTRGYQKYEAGETAPTPDVIDRFAEQLSCRPIDLLVLENAPVVEPGTLTDILKILENRLPPISKKEQELLLLFRSADSADTLLDTVRHTVAALLEKKKRRGSSG